MNTSSISKRADYGIDAPPVIRNLVVAGALSIAGGLVADLLLAGVQPVIATILLYWGIFGGAGMLVSAALMIWSSKVGKLREREHLLDALHLRGDEQVLDVGCGRGLLLNAAASRLTTGKATGIDLWQTQDQSGNRPEVTLANARAEGVADRVEIKTGDMREMPFADDSFDVVVSSLAIHNITGKVGRAQAIREIARVLKPGGRIELLDMLYTADYVEILRELGWRDVARSRRHFLMFPPVRIVIGSKPV